MGSTLVALVDRVNQIADTTHTGNELTQNDLLNVAQALATDEDAEIFFHALVTQLRNDDKLEPST